ncbi:MAG: methyltransferase domain-containing protein [Bacteroidota bacterium]
MSLKAIAGGIKSYFPVIGRTMGTGGTLSARYCYSVWLRHLCNIYRNGHSFPEIIAELGPGDSIGIGLAGLLSGAKKYYSLDVVPHINNERNVKIFDEISDLFLNKSAIPDDTEFTQVKPKLESHQFPYDVISEARLQASLDKTRLTRLRNDLFHIIGADSHEKSIEYYCPWYDRNIIKPETVDLIFSQAVLEHVEDLDNTYQSIFYWLKKGGLVSHQIDFKCHGTSNIWNGHWAYSDFTWGLIKGNKPYLLNREPLSTHIKMLERYKFKPLYLQPVEDRSGIKRSELAQRFKHFTDTDLTTSGVYILAVKEQ